MGNSSLPAPMEGGSEEIVAIPVNPLPANDFESSGVVDVSAFRKEHGSGIKRVIDDVTYDEIFRVGSGLMRHVADIRRSLRNIVFGSTEEIGQLKDVSVTEFQEPNTDMPLRKRLVSAINEANQIERMFRDVVHQEPGTVREVADRRKQFDFILAAAREFVYDPTEQDTRSFEEQYPGVKVSRRSGGGQDEVRMSRRND